MTYRDFFRVAIKLFALFVLIKNLMALFNYNLIAMLDYMELNSALVLTSLTLILFGICFLIIKNPDWFITVLKLDKGFDEDQIFTSKMNASSILKVGVVVTGLYLVITNISFFVQSILNYQIQSSFYESLSKEQVFNFSFEFIQIIVGTVFIALRDKIVGLFISPSDQLEEL